MPKKETKFNLEGLEEIANEQPNNPQVPKTDNILTDKQLDNVKNEVELERKYGDQDLRTFIESGASAASFGISDQVLTKWGGEEMQEAMRERRQRNEEAALAGEITGVVAPTLASGGTSLLAKGAAAGVKTAAKAGSFVERMTAKQLAKVIQETGKKTLAKQVIKKALPKTAGSAVEGAFYGAGELIKEDALGTAEFNAENLLASAGMGAALGGTVGGILGSTEALIPVVKNNRLVDVVSKKINKNIDKRVAGAKLTKMTTGEITKLKQTKWGQEIYDNIPKYIKDNLDLKLTDDTEKLFTKSNAQIKKLGDEIGDTVLEVDKIAKGQNIYPTKAQVARTVQKGLKELEEQFIKSPDEAAKKSLKKVRDRIKSWDDWANDNNPMTAVELKELKTQQQQVTKWNKSPDQIPLQGKMDRSVAESIRQEYMNLADSVSMLDQNLGDKLRKLNLDYGTALTVTNKLKRAVDKEASSEFFKFKDILVADLLTDASGGLGIATGAVAAKKFLESDFRRKLTLLTNIEKANLKVNKKITKGVKNFFSGVKKAAVPASTKTLLNTSFQLPDDNGRRRQKPTSKQEAFKNISEDLTELNQNPEKLISHLSTNALTETGTAPNTALAMNSTIGKAVQFLNEKLPRDPSPGTGLFARKWEPSSLELAKFERYLTAVEDPMSVLDDLESGSVTREAVEAIQAVYPDMYVRLQSQAIEEISQNPEISYDKRIQLGLLLDLPADTSLMPENVAALQQTFTDLEQQQNAAKKEDSAIKPSRKGMENISRSESAKSETERVQTRKQE